MLRVIVAKKEIRLLVLNHGFYVKEQAVFFAKAEFPICTTVNSEITNFLAG